MRKKTTQKFGCDLNLVLRLIGSNLTSYIFFITIFGNFAIPRSSVFEIIFVTTVASSNCLSVLVGKQIIRKWKQAKLMIKKKWESGSQNLYFRFVLNLWSK